MRLLQSLQRRFNGTSITIVVIGARSGRPVLSECRRSAIPALPAYDENASCVAVLCVSSALALLSHRSKCRRSRVWFLIHRSKSLPTRLKHRRSCVRRIIGNAAHKSPSVSSSVNCRASGAHTSNKEPTVVMIVGFFMPSAPHPVGHPHCWNHYHINVHIGWVLFARAPMVAAVQSVWVGFQTRA